MTIFYLFVKHILWEIYCFTSSPVVKYRYLTTAKKDAATTNIEL